jgi:cell wall-associated NlpC family hydrolase
LRAHDDQPADAQLKAAREKVDQQLRSIKERVAQLEKDGRHEEAQRLMAEGRELYSKLNQQSNAMTTLGSPEREQVRQQWTRLREKIEQAAKAGNMEEARRLNQEAEMLRAKLYPQGRGTPAGQQSDAGREARLQHLRAAAENLMAAGFQSEAQHVAEMAEHIKSEGHSNGDQTVQELRNQIEQLRREVHELREQSRQELLQLRADLNRAKGSPHD